MIESCSGIKRRQAGLLRAGQALLVALLCALPMLAAGSAMAADADALVAEAEGRAQRLRAMSHVILSALKETRDRHPWHQGVLTPEDAARARLELAPAAAVEADFQRAREEFDGLAAEAREAGGGGERLTAAAALADKAAGHVDRFWSRMVAAIGRPEPPAASVASGGGQTPPPGAIRIRGELQGGLSQASFEQTGVDDGLDESTSGLNFRATASTALPTGTELTARLGREQTVDRQEYTLTEFGIDAQHRLRGGWLLQGGFAREGYSDDASELFTLDDGTQARVKTANYSEQRLHAGVNWANEMARVHARWEQRGRSHDKDGDLRDFDRRDYDVNTLGLGGEISAGGGRLFGDFTSTARSAEAEGRDLDVRALRAGYRQDGALRLLAEFDELTHGGVDSLRTQRLKARLYFGGGSGGEYSRFIPEVLLYQFPDQENVGYAEYGFAREARSRDADSRRQLRMRLAYRLHENEDAFDFVRFTWNERQRPRSTGSYRTWSVAALGYVEGADIGDIVEVSENPSQAEVLLAVGALAQAFQTPRAPHRVDLSWEFGWVMARENSPVKRISLGPKLGHTLYIDSERKKLQDEAQDLIDKLPENQQIEDPLGDTDFMWRNPINRGRAGAELRAELLAPSGLRVDASLGYDLVILYNADPGQTFSSFDLEVRGSLPLRPDLLAEGSIRIHRAGLRGEDSASDYERSELRLGLRWLFDLAPGAAGGLR